MPKFSETSLEKLSECHQDLQTLFKYVIEYFDCTIVFGHRTPEEQFELFKKGRKEIYGTWVIKDSSKVVTFRDGMNKKSKHNEYPSLAVDCAPYPTLYGEPDAVRHFSGYVLGMADILYHLGHIENRIISGSDWDNDRDLKDQKFYDPLHFEIA